MPGDEKKKSARKPGGAATAEKPAKKSSGKKAPLAPSSIAIVRAMADDLDALAPLFDAYRVSYGGAPDPNRSRRFLGERLRTGQSMVLIALKGTETVGFAMLYPSFTSIHLQRLWILSDLFIRPEFRREGAARALVDRAAEIARETGARGVILQAPPDNRPAKELYASLEFVEEQRTHHFFLETIA